MTIKFIDAENEFAFLKAGIFGFSGSGKTRTATEIAIGLFKYANLKKPVGFLDTEIASDAVQRFFKENSIPLKVLKTRAFKDLLEGIDYAEKEFSVLIIDSLTHFWTELQEAFMKRNGSSRIAMHQWRPIKKEWRQYVDRFLLSKLHIIQCGRASYVYDYEKDESGVNQLVKTDVTMKAEGETEFEPPLVIEMIQDIRMKDIKKRSESDILHIAWVIKDRYHDLTGKSFIHPTFNDFLPHIQNINLNGKHIGYDPSSSSETLFDSPSTSRYEEEKQKKICLEEIKDEIVSKFPNSDVISKEKKKQFVKDIFGTTSWTAIENMKLDILSTALSKIRELSKIEKFSKESKKYGD